MNTVGIKLRELREKKGMLLREVGASLSIDPTILSKIERDERMPTKKQVQALANFYNNNKNELIIAWLSDKLAFQVKDEIYAIEAINEAIKKIKCLKRKYE